MTDELKTERFQLMLTDSEAKEIDEYRWRNRVPSQAEAVRQLIKSGLKSEAMKEGNAK